MAVGYNPSIVSDGLIYFIDPANRRSYPGTGTSINGLISGFGGTLYNGAGFTSSNNGTFVFDGTNDILRFSGVDIFDSVYTQCAWFKMNVLQPSLIVDGGYAGTVAYSNRIDFYYTDTSPFFLNATINLSSSTWYYVCSVRGASQKQIYLNSNLIASVNSSDSYSCPYNYIQIGSNNGSDNLNGNIGQVQIYNRALSQQEILQNFNATRFRYGV